MKVFNKEMYIYSSFITKKTKFGLFDLNGDLRFTSYDLSPLILKREELNWEECPIRRLTVTKNGVKFGKVVEE